MTKITHNSYLFAGTVKENLRMAKPDATREELEYVLEKVNLLAFLKEQDGLQTVLLVERGKLLWWTKTASCACKSAAV